MGSKDKLKEIDIKNCTCYYFDDTVGVMNRDSDFDFNDNEKLHKEKDKKILICDISYKTSVNAKPLHIRFNKKDGFIKVHNGTRCLVLFDYGSFDKICDRIKYLLSGKSGIIDSINHTFVKIRIESYNSLPI